MKDQDPKKSVTGVFLNLFFVIQTHLEIKQNARISKSDQAGELTSVKDSDNKSSG